MPDKPFKHTKPRAIGTDHRRCLIRGDFLIAVCFQKLANPQPACIPACLFCWQRVVGADHLVAIGHICACAKEQRTVTGHVFKEPVITVGHDLHMFRRNIVCHLQHLVIAVTDNDLAIVAPADRRRIRGRQDGQQPVNLGQGITRQRFGIGQQNSWRVIAMFGLAKQIGRA